MGLYENSLSLIPEGDEKEFFGFMRSGYGKLSSSKTFLSVFTRLTLRQTEGSPYKTVQGTQNHLI